MTKKISVIIITYNHGKYLKQCLDSVLEQDVNFSYEVIVGNDKSPDNTQEILEVYDRENPEMFTMLNREKNLGPTKNLYDLIKRAKGEYIIFLEGDDYWTDKNKLQKMVDYFSNNNQYIGVFHRVNEIDENYNVLSTYPRKGMEKYVDEINNIDEFMEIMIKGDLGQIFHIQSILFKNVFKDNITNELEDYITCGEMICDINIKLFILFNGKIKFIDDNMGNYRRICKKGGTSFSAQSRDFIFKDAVRVWYKINEYYNYKYNKRIKNILSNMKRQRLIEKFSNDRKLEFKDLSELNYKCKVKYILRIGSISMKKYLMSKKI